MTKRLLMGNEAMAHAALEAGVRVIAGYPGTPSSEIVETIAKLHVQGSAHDVHVEWSTNEKVALEVLFGASLAGARGLFTCKQMGLNVASDALMSLNYVSVRGGLVLVVADDPGPISSQTEQDTRRFAAFAKVPVLDPSTPEQAFAMIKAAFDLSERYHTPVIVRPTTRVDHASAFFDVADETYALPVPEAGFERDTSKWVIFPRRAFAAHGEINERLGEIAQAFANEDVFSPFNSIVDLPENAPGTATSGIMAGGISAAYTREALRIVEQRVRDAGIDMPRVRFMQVGTPYPFPTQAAARFVEGLSDVLVIEELDYVLEDELARLAGRARLPISIHGKLTDEARDRGENDVDDIVGRLERFLGLAGRLRLHRREASERDGFIAPIEYAEPQSLPVRPPVLCPGCPHRGTFYAIKQALRNVDAVMCGDIGCYTLGNAQPLDAVDTCLCMGAGVTMAQGISIVDPQKKAIAYIGDSTFFASGMTGLANAAYNGHDITVIVLDNATTAMTGSQPHPGTGITLMGAHNEPLSIENALIANGFKHVYHANPLDKDASIVAAKAAIAYEGPSAVIFESPCIQLIKPDAPVSIDVDLCTGCKKCITEIGCPGIGFNLTARGARSGERGQAFVDPALCNGCDLCVQICPFKAIKYPPVTLDNLDEIGEANIIEALAPTGKVSSQTESADQASTEGMGLPTSEAEPQTQDARKPEGTETPAPENTSSAASDSSIQDEGTPVSSAESEGESTNAVAGAETANTESEADKHRMTSSEGKLSAKDAINGHTARFGRRLQDALDELNVQKMRSEMAEHTISGTIEGEQIEYTIIERPPRQTPARPSNNNSDNADGNAPKAKTDSDGSTAPADKPSLDAELTRKLYIDEELLKRKGGQDA